MSGKRKRSKTPKSPNTPDERKRKSEKRQSEDSSHAHPQPHLIVKRVRGPMLDRDEKQDLAAARFIYSVIEEFRIGDGGPTPTIAKWYRAVSHMPALTQLFEALDILGDCNLSYVDANGIAVTPHPEALRRIVLFRFLAGLVDSDGWYPARWYETQFGIKGHRLRQWVKRRQLTNRRVPSTNRANQTVYPLAGVRALAPEVILDFTPPRKRDNA